jgi:alkanesulfonate monooxygenase SsuD/methylene tetrahydromethanopterin reductase-like flavin-dependent oxidoreductase (luciferase family)
LRGVELPLDPELRAGPIGVTPSSASVRQTATLVDRLGYDSIWVGDHISFPVPILDPLL